jgi:hypothetical protein
MRPIGQWGTEAICAIGIDMAPPGKIRFARFRALKKQDIETGAKPPCPQAHSSMLTTTHVTNTLR